MKNFILILAVLISFSSFSQEGNSKEKAIETIEELNYHEFYMGNKCYYKIDIDYNDITEQINVTKTTFLGDNLYSKSTQIFYLKDIDLSTLTYQLLEAKPEYPDRYMVFLEVYSKGDNIKIESVSMNTKEFPYPVSKTTYTNKLSIDSTTLLPKDLGTRLVESIEILLSQKD